MSAGDRAPEPYPSYVMQGTAAIPMTTDAAAKDVTDEDIVAAAAERNAVRNLSYLAAAGISVLTDSQIRCFLPRLRIGVLVKTDFLKFALAILK